MSTILKKISQLPTLSQAMLSVIMVLIIIDLVVLKLTVRWWRNKINILTQVSKTKSQTQPKLLRQLKTETSAPQKNISLSYLVAKILQSYSPIEPCLHNLSANKFPILFLLQIWVYLFVYALVGESLGGYGDGGHAIRARVFGVVPVLGWGLVVLAILDTFIRYFIAKSAFQKYKSQSSQESTQGSTCINKQYPHSLIIPLYYTLLSTISVALCILSMIQIMSDKKFAKKQPNLSTQTQPNQFSIDDKVITVLIDLLIVTVSNYVAVVGVFALLATLAWFLDIQIGTIGKFLTFAFGVQVENKERKNKVHIQELAIAEVEESKENIGHITDRNNLQNLIFTQHNQNSQKSSKNTKKQKFVFNTPELYDEKLKNNLTGTRKKRKEILLTQSQLNISEVKAKLQKLEAKKREILEKKSKSMEVNLNEANRNKIINVLENQIPEKPSQIVEKTEKKKSKLFFNQEAFEENSYEDFPQKTNSNQNLKKNNKKSRIASLFIHTQNNQQEEQDQQVEKQVNQFQVLGNIQNRVSACSSFKKRKRQKGQLRIVDCAQNQIEIQAIDLSKYAVKNLGYVQSKTIDYKPAVSRFKKKSILPPLNLATPSNKKHKLDSSNSSVSNKKNMMKSPSVSDTPTDGFTFCLHDIKHHADSQ